MHEAVAECRRGAGLGVKVAGSVSRFLSSRGQALISRSVCALKNILFGLQRN